MLPSPGIDFSGPMEQLVNRIIGILVTCGEIVLAIALVAGITDAVKKMFPKKTAHRR